MKLSNSLRLILIPKQDKKIHERESYSQYSHDIDVKMISKFSCSVICDSATSRTAARVSITNSWSLLKLMSIESVKPSNHLIHCHPLLLLSSIFPRIRVFQMSQLFASGGQVLEFQPQHESFQGTPRTDLL